MPDMMGSLEKKKIKNEPHRTNNINNQKNLFMTNDTINFGKYILLDKVAVGGMAELYRAKLTGAEGFEKLIAIKKILGHLNFEEKLLTSFIDEAKLAAHLHHPNIVQIYDFGCMDDIYFIAMEYLAGKDLRYTLKKSGQSDKPFSLEMILYIISCLCDGLDYAHTLKDFAGNPLNIIHRDIGPQNLFITYDGQVKIIDFGIAKAATQSTNTQSGIIKGKVAYMSPEQANGDPIDYRSDIFSVGVIFYELLSRTKMYQGDTFQALSKARSADFIPLRDIKPDLPEAVYQILDRALEKEPAKRYQSAHDMFKDIENFMIDIKVRVSQRELSNFMQELFDEEGFTDECKTRECISAVHPDAENATYITAEKNINQYDSTIDIDEVVSKKGGGYFLYASFLVLIIVAIVYVWLERETYLPVTEKIKVAVYETKHEQISIEKLKKLVEEKKYAEAVAGCEKALKISPEVEMYISPVYSSALTGIVSGIIKTDTKKAARLLDKANKLNPQNVDALLLLGKLYTQLNENRRAIDYYKTAAALDKENPESFFNLGYNYAVLNDFGKAQEMYIEVVELAPKFTDEALFNLALINDKIGNRKEAIVNLKAAIKVNPKNKNARKFLKKITSE